MQRHLIALAVLTVTILTSLALHSPISAATNSAGLDPYLETYVRENNIPGLQVAVVENDHIAYMRGFGIADPSGRKVTPQTSFSLCSLSKSFTALAVMQLVEAGKIELDAPVQRYLPRFHFAQENWSAQITVRHLLNHNSGIPNRLGNIGLDDRDLSDDALDTYIRSFSTFELARAPGSAYEYSNANYDTLGLLVQSVSGQPFETYLQEHIFSPLDMKHTFASQNDTDQHEIAMGHRLWFGRPVPAPNMPLSRKHVPSGFIFSSAEDMAHYLIAHLNNGQWNRTILLSPAGIAELHRPAVATRHGFYAMGWAVSDGDIGVPAVWHDGRNPDFASYMALIPEGQWGLVVLVNENSYLGAENIYTLMYNIARILVGQKPVALAGTDWGYVGALVGLSLVIMAQIIGAAISIRRRVKIPFVLLHWGWAWALWYVVPSFFEQTFSMFWLYQPDVALLMSISIFIALTHSGWILLRRKFILST